MSFVIVAPEMVADAATNLASLGSTISAANAAAAAPTTGVAAAAGDEVSAAIATMLSQYASAYQGMGAQAAALHARLVQTLNAGAGAYAAADAANAAPLQTLEQDVLGAINAPTNTLLGRPLIGNGSNGTTDAEGVGTSGGAGGILWGNGGGGGDSIAAGSRGGAGGPAGLLGTGGTGGMGGWGAPGGTGGTGGLLWGNGGIGGTGGPTAPGGAGGSALLFGNGGPGGEGGEIAAGGVGGQGGLLVGNGGTGGQGGVLGAGGQGGPGGMLWGQHGATGQYGGEASVELTMAGTRPHIGVSVNGGPEAQATVDTGSTTTLFAKEDVNLESLGPSTGSGVYTFGETNHVTVVEYDTYTAQLNFGHGIITQPMTIGVIESETFNGQPGTPETLLGVGASTASPPNFATSAVQQLPGALSQGVLINEPNDQLVFGPNPLTPFASAAGAPSTNDLQISLNGDYPGVSTQHAFIDTGGVNGSIPQALAPGYSSGEKLAPGTTVSVYVPGPDAGNPVLVYSEIMGTNGMDVVPNGDSFNTGNYVFSKIPIYFSYTSYSPTGVGTTFFDTAT